MKENGIREIWDDGKKYIRHRLKDPKLFQEGSFRTIKVKKDKPRVNGVVGKLKGKKVTTLQSLLFPKEDGWTLTKAKEWSKERFKKGEINIENGFSCVSETILIDEKSITEGQRIFGKYQLLQGENLDIPEDFLGTTKEFGDDNPMYVVVPVMSGYSQYTLEGKPHRRWRKEVVYNIANQIKEHRVPAYPGHAGIFNMSELPDIPAIWLTGAKAKNTETGDYGILVKGYVYPHGSYRMLIKTGAIQNASVFGFGDVESYYDEEIETDIDDVKDNFKLVSLDFVRKRTEGMPETSVISVTKETFDGGFDVEDVNTKENDIMSEVDLKELSIDKILEQRPDIKDKISLLEEDNKTLQKDLSEGLKLFIEEFCKTTIKLEGVKKIAKRLFIEKVKTFKEFEDNKDTIVNEAKSEYVNLAKELGLPVNEEGVSEQKSKPRFSIASKEIQSLVEEK